MRAGEEVVKAAAGMVRRQMSAMQILLVLNRQGVATMPKRVAVNGAKRHTLVDPSFSAADIPLFCKALSVGLTFLCAAWRYSKLVVAVHCSHTNKTMFAHRSR